MLTSIVSLGLIVLTISRQMLLVESWMNAPYGSESAFNYREHYGGNVTMKCEDDRLPSGYTFQYWIRPDLTVMREGEQQQFWTLDGYATWQVSSSGLELDVTNLNQRQFGFYYCVVRTSDNETIVVKKGINYLGPYFGNLWPKYRMNVIIGLSAAAIFLVFMIVCCAVAAYCGRHPETDEVKAESHGVVKRTRRNSPNMATSSESYGLKRRDVTSFPGYDESDVIREEVRL